MDRNVPGPKGLENIAQGLAWVAFRTDKPLNSGCFFIRNLNRFD
jgi:hypothetical protein